MNVHIPHYISGVDKAGIASVRELLSFCFGVPSCSCCCGGCCRIVTSISGRAYSNGGEPGGGEAGRLRPMPFLGRGEGGRKMGLHVKTTALGIKRAARVDRAVASAGQGGGLLQLFSSSPDFSESRSYLAISPISVFFCILRVLYWSMI